MSDNGWDLVREYREERDQLKARVAELQDKYDGVERDYQNAIHAGINVTIPKLEAELAEKDRQIQELQFQKVFEQQFADRLKEFGTVDRLVEEYSTAKMKARDLESSLKAMQEKLQKAEAALKVAVDALKIAVFNSKNKHNRLDPSGGTCWTTCAACVYEDAVKAIEKHDWRWQLLQGLDAESYGCCIETNVAVPVAGAGGETPALAICHAIIAAAKVKS